MIYAAALLYVATFWIVSWKWPKVGLMLIFACAPFQNDISGGFGGGGSESQGGAPPFGPMAFSLSELHLLLIVPIFFLRMRPILQGPTIWAVVLYFITCLLSGFLNWRPASMASLVQIIMYLVVTVAVFASFTKNAEDFRFVLNGLTVVGFILAIAVIVTRSGYVFGLHKNGVGSSLACAVVVNAELWFAASKGRTRAILAGSMAVMVAGLFFSLSRGGWMGAMCGIFVLLALRRRLKLMMRIAVICVPLVVICWGLLPTESREYVTGFERDNWNIKMRYASLDYAYEVFNRSPWLGVGVGLRKEYDATNLFWLTLAETGILGLVTFSIVHIAVFRMVWKTHRYLRHNDILFSVVALSGALAVSKFIHGMVDIYWSRGSIMITWASVGMATHAYFVVRRRLAATRIRRALDVPSRTPIVETA